MPTTQSAHRATKSKTAPQPATPAAGRVVDEHVDVRTFDQLLTTADVALQLRTSTRTVRRMIDARELPAYRVGGGYRVHPDALATYLTARRTA